MSGKIPKGYRLATDAEKQKLEGDMEAAGFLTRRKVTRSDRQRLQETCVKYYVKK